MSDTKAANPPATDDASLDAAVAELADQAAASAAGSTTTIAAASPLDAALAATADELSEFADVDAVLGSPVTVSDIPLEEDGAAAPESDAAITPDAKVTEPAVAGATMDERSAAAAHDPIAADVPADAAPAAPSEPLPADESAVVSVLSPPLENDDLSDFADPVTVLSAISRDLESLSPPTSAEPLAESAPGAATNAAAATLESDSHETATPEATEPAPPDQSAEEVIAAKAAAEPDSAPTQATPLAAASGAAIEQLDDVLATKAEAVLEQTPEKPRVADAAASEPAPMPVAATPTGGVGAAPSAKPAAVAPTARPEPAPIETPVAAAPRPSLASRLKPLVSAAIKRLADPLVALDSKLSHGTRQTIAWVALFTIFNATAVWGIVLIRGPAKAPEPSGQTTPFYKPGDPIPHDAGHGSGHGGGKHDAGSHGTNDSHGGGHGASTKSGKGGHDDGHAARKDDHGKPASQDKAKGKGGHGHTDKKAEKKPDKKKDSHAKADSKSKKKGKETAAAGHH